MNSKLIALIENQDNNEIVRDQIAAILKVEINNQKSLAIASGKNPEDFDFDVYVERTRPFEILSSEQGDELSQMPLVNILFDNDTFDNKNSDQTYRQRAKGTFYIDCYAHKNRVKGRSADENVMGDELTSKESDRIARLVRNIIMSAEYYQLALGYREFGTGKNIVFHRLITRREKFVPSDREGHTFENIIATRLTLEVDYDVYSHQINPRDFDILAFQCTKSDDGQVYFEAEYDFTE